VKGSASTLVARLADDARFLAGWIGDGHEAFAHRLRIGEKELQQLLLCKAPTRDHFAADVVAIADYVGLDALDLAGALREAAVYAALRTQPPQHVGLLAAAREREAESFRPRAGSRVRRAVQEFWNRVPSTFHSSYMLERIVPLALPVAVVAIPKLGVGRAKNWLADRGLELPLPVADRRLQGLLLSWRGLSLLMIDGGLDAAERRVTVGHEVGHVVLDYLARRAQVMRDAPTLLGVIDGHRPLTTDERVHAALEGLPVGIQAHMLARDASGAAAVSVDAAERDASAFALELLAPERDVVAMLRDRLQTHLAFDEALDRAADLIRGEFELPPDEARARARGALAALGRRRGFFEP
jgi:hypothetical protein